MKRQLAFGIFTLMLASLTLACRLSITPTPTATVPPSITPTITQTPVPTNTPTLVPTATPPLTAQNGPALIELHMFNYTQGWGLTESQVLLTNDGGHRWAQVPLPGAAYNRSVGAYFVDVNVCFFFVPGANKQPGQVFSSRDRGAHWEMIPTTFNNAKLYFPNDNVGFAMETLSTSKDAMTLAIYQTLDRGKTWTQVFVHTADQGDKNLPVAGIKTGMSFIDPSIGFIGLSKQKNSVAFYHVEDAGRNWVKQALKLPDNLPSDYESTVWPAFFFSQNGTDGILPVDYIDNAASTFTRVFYTTHDSGATWAKKGQVPEGAASFFINALTGWAWGKQGLYGTNNNAKTWNLMPAAFGPGEKATIINFIDEKNGWLTTTDAKNVLRLYRSTDGGATWIVLTNE